MKKTVQIVTIPLDKEGWSKNDIVMMSGTIQFPIYAMESDIDDCQAQQLLVLSDDDVQVGDVYEYHGSVAKYESDTHAKHPHFRNVIASYPHIDGTLPISKKTVQAWIDSGTPEGGSIEIKHKSTGRNTIGITPAGEPIKMNSFIETPKLDSQGNLLVEFTNREQYGYTVVTPKIGEEIGRAVFTLKDNSKKIIPIIKPIPTDEEIEQKGKDFLKEFEKDMKRESYDRWGIVIGYFSGYKQALKDLGYADN